MVIVFIHSEIYPKFDVERKLGKFRTVISLEKSLQSASGKPKDLWLRILTDCNISDEEPLFNDTPDLEKAIEDQMSNDSINSESDNDRIDLDGLERKPSCTRTHVEIKQESVNYLGYYSSHEQLMQQLILECARSTKKQLTEMANQGNFLENYVQHVFKTVLKLIIFVNILKLFSSRNDPLSNAHTLE